MWIFFMNVLANMKIFVKISYKNNHFLASKLRSKIDQKLKHFLSDFLGSFFGGHFWPEGQFSMDVLCETHILRIAFFAFFAENGSQEGPKNRPKMTPEFEAKITPKKGTKMSSAWPNSSSPRLGAGVRALPYTLYSIQRIRYYEVLIGPSWPPPGPRPDLQAPPLPPASLAPTQS